MLLFNSLKKFFSRLRSVWFLCLRCCLTWSKSWHGPCFHWVESSYSCCLTPRVFWTLSHPLPPSSEFLQRPPHFSSSSSIVIRNTMFISLETVPSLCLLRVFQCFLQPFCKLRCWKDGKANYFPWCLYWITNTIFLISMLQW